MEENRSNVLLTVIGIATLLVVLVGASFAYFTATDDAAAEDITTGKLLITTSFTANQGGTEITPTEFTYGEDNEDVAKFIFTVDGTQTTVDKASYDIQILGTAAIKEGKGGDLSEIAYSLHKKGNATAVATGTFDEISSLKAIVEDVELNKTAAEEYELYVYIDESGNNQDNLQDVTINVSMNALARTPELGQDQ